MSTPFKGKSMKGATDEIWNPTSNKVNKDGKDWTVPNPNPEKGKEPQKTGYYIGSKLVESKKPDQKPNTLHQFRDEEGNEFGIWGTYDLTKQLDAAKKECGLGFYCMVQWNGKFKTKSGKEKPEGVPLTNHDWYQDWEVTVSDEHDPIKIDSVVSVPSGSNTHTLPEPSPTPATNNFPNTATELPTSLNDDGGDDLPY